MSLFVTSKINHVWYLLDNLRKENKRGRFQAIVAMPASNKKDLKLFEDVKLSPLLQQYVSEQGILVLNFGNKSCPELTIDLDGNICGHTSVSHAPVSFKIPAWYVVLVECGGELATFDTYVPVSVMEQPADVPVKEEKKRPQLTLVKS